MGKFKDQTRMSQGLVDNGYLSDDSQFYGDEAAIHHLEARALSFSSEEWFQNHSPSLMDIAASNIGAGEARLNASLYNPYEGQSWGWQLSESVQEFLERLSPASAVVSESLKWIFIANPYQKARIDLRDEDAEVKHEGPADEKSDWAKFVREGTEQLNQLMSTRRAIEKINEGKAKATVTKKVNPEKEKVVKKILDTAKELHCTSGKWMLFCQPEEVNEVWSVIAHATAKNELGTAAKVGPDEGDNRKPRLLCVYTKDFTDLQDVSRVVHKLKDLGVIESTGNIIYYKCDAYTYLGLTSSNEYNIKASMYNSKDVLQGKILGVK